VLVTLRLESNEHENCATEAWDAGKLKMPIVLNAMSLNIALDDGHPNKMPFSGVLTRIEEPSDRPPEGSGGRLITISAEAAEKALSSLLGMAVDYKPNLDGHDPPPALVSDLNHLRYLNHLPR
jgi:hypothetical protein